MKKIIMNSDGKPVKYNTESPNAKPICTRSLHATKDFTTVVISAFETIYRKENSGEYFLYHEPTGEHVFDLEYKIRPLTEKEALKYCADWMDGEEYEQMFGEVDE